MYGMRNISWSMVWATMTTLLRRLVASSIFVVVVVDSARISPRSCGGAVRHVHLAVGLDPATQMTVSFASIPSKFLPPFAGVLVGTSPSTMTDLYVETHAPTNYNLTVEKGSANFDDKYYSPHYHHVTVSGLEPSTVYYYKPIVKANLGGFDNYNLRTPKERKLLTAGKVLDGRKESPENQSRRRLAPPPYDGSEKGCPSPDKIRSFRTAPAAGTVNARFAIVGDLGQFPHSAETMARLLRSRNDIDAVILAGDVAYPGHDHRSWDTFFDFMDDYPVAERIPLQICPGNHDIDKLTESNEIFLAYENRFRMPQVRPAELGVYDGPTGVLDMATTPYPLPYEWGNSYYAYSYGGARFLMINAYSSMSPGSSQYEWFLQEAKLVNRSVTPWLIVVIHTPLYNTFSHHLNDPQIFAAKEHLEPLFVKYKVNMVFSGHIHAYLRTTNVAMGVPDPKGPVHITVGAGGRKCSAPFKSIVPEPWVEVRDATIFGYGVFRILNETVAEWDWIHTGRNDKRDYNEVKGSKERLASGPASDRVYIQNQLYL
jgi:acid phosphatase type 7